MNPTHGGKRPNSGRKPRATPKAQLSVRIEPHHAAKLRTHCKRRGISQAAWVTERIEENVRPLAPADNQTPNENGQS